MLGAAGIQELDELTNQVSVWCAPNHLLPGMANSGRRCFQLRRSCSPRFCWGNQGQEDKPQQGVKLVWNTTVPPGRS